MKISKMYILALGLRLSAIYANVNSEKLERKLEEERRFGKTEIHPPDPENPSVEYYPIFTAEY